MSEPISIQQLKDASEDAISLADFINKPENVMIPRRLASDINSLQYYLEYMKSFAQRSYETYDEMVANTSNLSENVSVFVTNDLDTSKNGIYTYNGTAFVRGEYQPENAAKEFIEAKLAGLEVFDGKVRSQDVSTEDGGTQDVKNTEFRNELDALPFEGGVLADTFVTMTKKHTDAVARSLQDISSETLSVLDFGVKAGIENAVANCDAYAKLAAYVNAKGGYTIIHWAAASEHYYFAPKDHPIYGPSVDVSWRGATELVDVKQTYHMGYGATVHVVADPEWYRGLSPAKTLEEAALINNANKGDGNDESPIQFRGNRAMSCDKVGVFGLNVTTDRTKPFNSSTTDTGVSMLDGNCIGIAYKAANNTITKDVYVTNWGTDGILIGGGYGAVVVAGKTHYMENVHCDGNYRQGLTIGKASNGTVIGCSFTNNGGNNFGYGIDIEPDEGEGGSWVFLGIHTENNNYGALNHIRARNITYVGCTFMEESDAPTNIGAVRVDGNNNVENLRFINCTVAGRRAVVRIDGQGLNFLRFEGCRFSCSGAVVSSGQVLITASELTHKNISFKDCIFRGNGGYSGLDAEVEFDNCTWDITGSKEGVSENRFIINHARSGYLNLINCDVTINEITGTWDTSGFFINNGFVDKCTFKSYAGNIITIRDSGAGRNVVIGTNTYDDFFYYSGVQPTLDIKGKKGTVQVPAREGAMSRRVHGGYWRVKNYQDYKSSFSSGQQKPQHGDITETDQNLVHPDAYGRDVNCSYIYDEFTDQWRLYTYSQKHGATSERPKSLANLGAANNGWMFYDTTVGHLLVFSNGAWKQASAIPTPEPTPEPTP